MRNKIRYRLFVLLLTICIGWVCVLWTPVVSAAGFTQGSGYSVGKYDLNAAQPSAFNWMRQSRFSGSSDHELKWSFPTGGSVYSSPVIGADGMIYIGSDDGKLYAINPDGTEKWSFPTKNLAWIRSSAAIGADGTVYVVSSEDKLHAINPQSGNEIWSYTTGGSIQSSPSIGSDGTIYVGSEDSKLYAINPDGTLEWSFATDGTIRSSPAISTDGTIYVGSADSHLYAINPDGSMKWSYDAGTYVPNSPVIDNNGTIYVSSVYGVLHAVNPNGTEKWVFKVDNFIWASASIGSDGTIYVGCDNGKLYAIDQNGVEKWHYSTSSPVDSSPIIGADGLIYVGLSNKLYALNSLGVEQWSYTTGSSVDSSPAIGANGTIYVGSHDRKLYAIGTATPPIPTGAQLNGNIIDTVTHAPANGLTLTFRQGLNVFDGPIAATTTAAYGAYSIHLSAGDYTAVITGAGYQPSSLQVTLVDSPNAQTLDGTITPIPIGAQLSGNIIDTVTHAPANGLTLTFRQGLNVFDGPSVATTTAANGAYSIHLSAGDYTAVITGAGYQPSSLQVTLVDSPNAETLDGTITPLPTNPYPTPATTNSYSTPTPAPADVSLNGIIIDTVTKAPANGLTLTFRRGLNVVDGPITATTTAKVGEYNIKLPPGDYTAVITGAGYKQSSLLVTLSASPSAQQKDGTITPLTIDLSGMITDTMTKAPANGLTLTFREGKNIFDGPIVATTTAAYGEYNIKLPVGDYTAVITGEGYQPSSLQVTLMNSPDAQKKDGTITPPFGDISKHWAEKHIILALSKNIINGYPDRTFKPDNPISRAEFIVMLANVLKWKDADAAVTYTDSGDIAAWAQKAVVQATQAEIIRGYEDGSFRPNANITRAEMATIIARALLLPIDTDGKTGFADDEQVPHWAKGAVKATREKGIVVGRSNNMFFPNIAVTRAEVAVMLLRMLELE